MAESGRIPLTVALPTLPKKPEECPAWAAKLTAALAAAFRRLGQATATGIGAGVGGAGAPGAQGVPGVAAFLVAEPGVDGEPGPPGRDGSAGSTGAVGPTGPAIFLVADAEEGPSGSPGPPGAAGVDGATGTTGAAGPAGPALFLLGDEGPEGGLGPPGPPGAGGGGGDNIQINGVAVIDANFNDTTPAAPTAFLNGTWQRTGSGPDSVSVYVPEGGTYHVVAQDLGVARRSGTFDITSPATLVAGRTVNVQQSAQPIGSKGNARDEGEMDAISAYAYTVDATTIRVYWWAPSVVVGTYNFAYQVAGN